MNDFLETMVGKFIFKVPSDRLYSEEGVWALFEDGMVRVGLSDFLQQRSGDIAFADLASIGSQLSIGDTLADIETIKVDLSVATPLSGQVVEVNASLEEEPELINQDPYGQGWLAVLEPGDWAKDRENLLSPQAYFERMQAEAEEEAGK